MKLDDLIGKPFAYGGRKDTYDCYGLAIEIYKRLGIEIPDFGTATEPLEQDILVNCGQKQFQKIEKPEPYSIVCFSVRPPYVSHVGVILPNLFSFIHCMQRVNVCIERLDSPSWKHRIRGYYKWVN